MTEDPTQVKTLLQYLQALTGVKVETIFTVMTTLFVFSAGLFTNWLINVIKEKNNRKNYKDTINLLLYDLSIICKNQSKVTLKDLNTHNILDGQGPGIRVHVYAPVKFLVKMDYSLFIKYYVQRCNRELTTKAATKVFQIIGYATIIESNNEQQVKSFMEEIKPMQELYIKNMLLLEEFGRTVLSIDVIDYDFKLGLMEIFDNWATKHNNNHFRNSFTNLISPLIRLISRYTLEPFSKDLYKITSECHVAYSEMSHANDHIKTHLESFALENRRMYKQLSVILKIFGYKR